MSMLLTFLSAFAAAAGNILAAAIMRPLVSRLRRVATVPVTPTATTTAATTDQHRRIDRYGSLRGHLARLLLAGGCWSGILGLLDGEPSMWRSFAMGALFFPAIMPAAYSAAMIAALHLRSAELTDELARLKADALSRQAEETERLRDRVRDLEERLRDR